MNKERNKTNEDKEKIQYVFQDYGSPRQWRQSRIELTIHNYIYYITIHVLYIQYNTPYKFTCRLWPSTKATKQKLN